LTEGCDFDRVIDLCSELGSSSLRFCSGTKLLRRAERFGPVYISFPPAKNPNVRPFAAGFTNNPAMLESLPLCNFHLPLPPCVSGADDGVKDTSDCIPSANSERRNRQRFRMPFWTE
jgi:hypothetical protein